MTGSSERNPAISVIVPVYNAQATLARCVESILAQSYTDFEVILVDDGATDDSPGMIDRYEAEHPGLVRALHRENGGLMRAWSDGVGIAAGDYFCFVDSDDWIDPEMLEKMAERLIRNSETGCLLPGQIVCCGCSIEYPDHPRLEGHGLPEGVYEGERLLTQVKRELLGHEKRRITFSRCMKLFSRELILKNLHLLDPSIRLGEDGNITVPAILDADRVVIMYAPFYHYLYLGASMSHRHDAGFYDDCRRLRACLSAIVREKGMPSEEMVRREFLFLFLQTVKVEVRRSDGRDAVKKGIRRIQELCRMENAAQLLASYPERMTNPANRLMAFICMRPSALRIRAVRLIFRLYEALRF